jgi:hypothetical protein
MQAETPRGGKVIWLEARLYCLPWGRGRWIPPTIALKALLGVEAVEKEAAAGLEAESWKKQHRLLGAVYAKEYA